MVDQRIGTFVYSQISLLHSFGPNLKMLLIRAACYGHESDVDLSNNRSADSFHAVPGEVPEP